ncbi:MAG TPA: acyl-CoA desaturase [Alphaproteobacteria bacterium]|nr:acyl-CoA desaturase [Alphaproteobacteria bacterium]
MHHLDTAAPAADHADDILYPDAIPFVLAHLACFAAIWTGVSWQAAAVAVGLYAIRMFGICAGYHRYFSHRTYKTGRVFQFVLAFLAQSSAQRGVLWWAAKHRHHHKHSDQPADVHSPAQSGFFRAHVGWIFTRRHSETDYDSIRDFARFPELMWLDRHPYLPAFAMAGLAFALAGWSGLVVGFFWSTVALYHATFAINSLAHVVGRRRYVTGDDSRNNWFLALITLGEGWHNNHHAYQSSVRQGFRWWEFDPTFYVLKALSWIGVVWDLHSPPEAVLRGEQRLGRAVVEKVAQQLAATFPVERIAAELARSAPLEELRRRLAAARSTADLHLPALPTLDEVRRHAKARLAATPSLDDIARRTREVLVESVLNRLPATA